MSDVGIDIVGTLSELNIIGQRCEHGDDGTFLRTDISSDVEVNIDSLYVYNTGNIFDFCGDGTLTLNGVQKYDGTVQATKFNVYKEMAGNLYLKTNQTIFTTTYNSFPINFSGVLYDTSKSFEQWVPQANGTSYNSLNIASLWSAIDWKSSANLLNINNGVDGQILKIKSSTGVSIVSGGNIDLVSTPIVLSDKEYIELQYYGSQWHQIKAL